MNKFEGYTQHEDLHLYHILVVLSGCQWTIWRIYTTWRWRCACWALLFYQDVNEQIWRIYTTMWSVARARQGCFIRISMNNLKDIHNSMLRAMGSLFVVLSGFQITILLQKYKKSLKSANLLENILILQKKNYFCGCLIVVNRQ